MRPLITILEKHIKGVSGMDNPMVSRLLSDELPSVSLSQRTNLYGMAVHYQDHGDEDEVRVAEWLLGEITER